jgi:ABC-type transport system involved in Fe-S cluster assembly fused permease/ATPase subunit
MSNQTNTDKRHVSMRLRSKTLEKVNVLQSDTDARNRTEAIARAIDLAAWWIQKQKEGAKVYAEHPDGTRESVIVAGLELNGNEKQRQPA